MKIHAYIYYMQGTISYMGWARAGRLELRVVRVVCGRDVLGVAA